MGKNIVIHLHLVVVAYNNSEVTVNEWCSLTYPLRQLISLVVLPHVLQDQLHCAWTRHLPMEVHSHEGSHSRQESWNLLQLLPGMFHTVSPSMVNQDNTARIYEKGLMLTQHSLLFFLFCHLHRQPCF